MTANCSQPSDLVAAANKSYKETFLGVGDELSDGNTRQFGSISAVSTGLPVPEYNRAFVFNSPSHDELTTAVSWLRRQDTPFWVTMTASVVEAMGEFSAEFDLAHSHEDPVMALPTLAEVPSRSSSVTILSVTDSATFNEFVTVFTSVFDRSVDVTVRAFRASVSDENTHLFVGRLEGKAVACGVMLKLDNVAGVYSIGVLEEFRRQSIGRRMTEEALVAGRDAGCQLGVLQSSEMAYGLYEGMGFEQIATYHHFESTA